MLEGVLEFVTMALTRPTHLFLGTVVWREAIVVLSVTLMFMLPGFA